jgi:tetratricopeptide (TPR) repeat protein
LQFVFAVYLVAFGVTYLTLAARFQGVTNPLLVFPAYVGLPAEQSAALVQAVLNVFPLWAFWGLIGVALYSLIMMTLLFFRIPYMNFIYLVNAGILIVVGFTSMILFFDSRLILAASLIGLLLGLVQLWITLNLWNDFSFKEYRLQMLVSSGARNHVSLYLSARDFAEQGMWGRAIIYLRRAIVREPTRLPYHIALIVAYLNIKRYDLAEKALQEAERLNPDHADLLRLRQKLAKLQL